MGGRWLRAICVNIAMLAVAAPACAQAARNVGPLASLGKPMVAPVELYSEAPPAADAISQDLAISPNTAMPRLERQQPLAPNPIAMVQLAIESSEWIDPRYIENSSHPDDLGFWRSLCAGGHEQVHRLIQDYENFYLTENLLCVGLAVGVAAPIANSHADQGIRDWYQRGAGQANAANSAAYAFKQFGEWKYVLPIYAAFSIGEHLFPDSPIANTVGEFGNRSLRALAVGAPTVGILQVGLGSGRPYLNDSHWHPFEHSNGVSGHAFVGAVPFLTAASMTDNPFCKALLIAGSFGPAWSRIQTDDHYFSQVLLGWAFAYLSVESVNLTESQSRNVRIVPVALPRGVGLGVQINY
jgi:membrane-associated phospholipid phosphatase